MRNTRNWKHNGKDRKQYIRNGKVRIGDFDTPITATPGYWKRQTEFMFDDLEDEEE